MRAGLGNEFVGVGLVHHDGAQLSAFPSSLPLPLSLSLSLSLSLFLSLSLALALALSHAVELMITFFFLLCARFGRVRIGQHGHG